MGEVKPKRIVVISDLHCGNRSGLTPPDWQYKDEATSDGMEKWGTIQRAVWKFYAATLAKLQPIDLLVVNGDALDGKGERSGGMELLTADRREQVEMAGQAIELAGARKVLIIRGTPYHVGEGEDWESVLADRVKAAHCGIHEWVEAGGVVLDFKHRVSSSIIPHGRNTLINRAALWNTLWAERGLQPRADILIRSHVHYHIHGGDARRLVMTTPCLQAWSRYGSLVMEGTIDVGMISIDCLGKGRYTWVAHLADLQFMAPRIIAA
jgi:hypothetical protein